MKGRGGTQEHAALAVLKSKERDVARGEEKGAAAEHLEDQPAAVAMAAPPPSPVLALLQLSPSSTTEAATPTAAAPDFPAPWHTNTNVLDLFCLSQLTSGNRHARDFSYP